MEADVWILHGALSVFYLLCWKVFRRFRDASIYFLLVGLFYVVGVAADLSPLRDPAYLSSFVILDGIFALVLILIDSWKALTVAGFALAFMALIDLLALVDKIGFAYQGMEYAVVTVDGIVLCSLFAHIFFYERHIEPSVPSVLQRSDLYGDS